MIILQVNNIPLLSWFSKQSIHENVSLKSLLFYLYLLRPRLIYIFVCAVSHVQLFVTPGTGPHQVSLSMRFSRQEYCSRSPFPTPGESSQQRDQTHVSCVPCIDRQVHCMYCSGRKETFTILKEKDEVDSTTHSLNKRQALE